MASVAAVYEDRLAVDLPQYFMRYVEYLDVGKPLTIKAFSRVGTLNFNTIVISSPLEDEFSVEIDYNAMKLTASNYIPPISAIEMLNIIDDDQIFSVKTFELSLDSLKFYSDKTLTFDKVLKCELYLPKNYGTIKFTGKITEVDELYSNEYTMVYESMTETNRQNLLYYMYLYSLEED